MGKKQKFLPLPDKLRRTRRIFLILYLGTLILIPGMTFFFCWSIMGWEEMLKDFKNTRPQDIQMLFLILDIYSIPFLLFCLGMRSSHKECLRKYEAMPPDEQKQLDVQFQLPINMGQVIYTQKHFLHRDKYRLFFYYIHSYEEILWAYQAQSLYQLNQMDFLPTPVLAPSDLRFYTIKIHTRKGRKYAILMGDWKRFVSHLPKSTILGYGREQKQQAKKQLKQGR